MGESAIDRSGAATDGEKASRKRAVKAVGAQDVLRLIDLARSAGIKEMAKLRALSREYAERADAIERKLGSMLDTDASPRLDSSEMGTFEPPVAAEVASERADSSDSASSEVAVEAPVRSRRLPGAVAREHERIVNLVKGQPDGMRADEIRKALGLQRNDMPRLLREVIEHKLLLSRGEKRSTVYYAK
jgi:hypothetical protein